MLLVDQPINQNIIYFVNNRLFDLFFEGMYNETYINNEITF